MQIHSEVDLQELKESGGIDNMVIAVTTCVSLSHTHSPASSVVMLKAGVNGPKPAPVAARTLTEYIVKAFRSDTRT